MKTTVNLESKDVRAALARLLGVPLEQVVPLRYGFAVAGMSAAEVAAKIYGEVRHDCK